MVHDARKVGIRKRHATKWLMPQHVAGRGRALATEEEPGLRRQIRVSPSIQDDRDDIAPYVESSVREQHRQLVPQTPLVLAIGRRQQLGPRLLDLRLQRLSG